MLQHQLLNNQPISPFEKLKNGEIFNNRWKILGLLGQGGFGVVYQALDLNIEGREVAIKILTVDVLQSPDVLTRFKKEVSITSKLKSPNTLMIYDFGIIENSAYMVSELLLGETLEQKLQHSLLSISESIQIIKEVAQVLEEAHDENIVHRDIKPDNIFLNQNGTGYHVKLIDFGIAKVNEARAKMTATQSFFGTPTYMSPEQITDTSKVDSRSDIYSLGLVLYHCIVGKPPFESHDLYDLLKKQMEMDVPKIPFSQAEKHYEAINILISKMTAKNPNQRFQKISQVITMLSNIQSTIPIIKPTIQPTNQPTMLDMPLEVGKTIAYTSFNFQQFTDQMSQQEQKNQQDTLIEIPREFKDQLQNLYQPQAQPQKPSQPQAQPQAQLEVPTYHLNTIEFNAFAPKDKTPIHQTIELDSFMIKDSDEIYHHQSESKNKRWIILSFVVLIIAITFWYFSKSTTQSTHLKTITLPQEKKLDIQPNEQSNIAQNTETKENDHQAKEPNSKVKNQIDQKNAKKKSSVLPIKINLQIIPLKPQYLIGEIIDIEVYDEKSNLINLSDLTITSNGLGQINKSKMKMVQTGKGILIACLKEKKQICTKDFPLLVNELE